MWFCLAHIVENGKRYGKTTENYEIWFYDGILSYYGGMDSYLQQKWYQINDLLQCSTKKNEEERISMASLAYHHDYLDSCFYFCCHNEPLSHTNTHAHTQLSFILSLLELTSS